MFIIRWAYIWRSRAEFRRFLCGRGGLTVFIQEIALAQSFHLDSTE